MKRANFDDDSPHPHKKYISFVDIKTLFLDLSFPGLKNVIRVPKMIWSNIFVCLDNKTFFAIRCTCKKFHKITEDEKIWISMVEKYDPQLIKPLLYLKHLRENIFMDFLRSDCKKIILEF